MHENSRCEENDRIGPSWVHLLRYHLHLASFDRLSIFFAHQVNHPGVIEHTEGQGHVAVGKYGRANSINVLQWNTLQSLHYVIEEVRKKKKPEVVVNLVLATDILDWKQKQRLWFYKRRHYHIILSDQCLESQSYHPSIECIMQASDVAYRNCNILANLQQTDPDRTRRKVRSFTIDHYDNDPSIGWYQGGLASYNN